MVDIDTQAEGEIFFITVQGELDASSSIHLDTAIAEALESGYKKIAIGCSGLEYISSAGLGVFMSYIEDMKKEGKTMVIYGVNEKVKNVFQILGLDQLLTLVDTKEKAIEVVG
ncbi:STAS domain-containing protein [Roseivirga sp. BDSF3-8]|uniref:STAS domain-containing protein n=1 Tax=Roseivirga sp. BDSF3-8 TaxID=3241598 RepID=UPI003531D633